MHNIKPPIMYPIAATKPPNSNQIILPSNFMMMLELNVFLYIKCGRRKPRSTTSASSRARWSRFPSTSASSASSRRL
jgi:hypothetical protein